MFFFDIYSWNEKKHTKCTQKTWYWNKSSLLFKSAAVVFLLLSIAFFGKNLNVGRNTQKMKFGNKNVGKIQDNVRIEKLGSSAQIHDTIYLFLQSFG
jgi:hypothetical protein